MDDDDYGYDKNSDVEDEEPVFQEEPIVIEEEEDSSSSSNDDEEKKEKKYAKKKSNLQEKYNIEASKKTTLFKGYPETYKQLKQGVAYFDLSFWEDCKIAEETVLEFAIRKKDTVKGLYKCGKCKGEEVYTVSLQLRSGDEATDTFASCIACRNVWKVG